MAEAGEEVDLADIDMTMFEADAAAARVYVEDQRRRGHSADSRADGLDEADPTSMSPADIEFEGNRISAALEATTLRLRLLGQDAKERLARYEHARGRALLYIRAPSKPEREMKADLVPHVAALREAAEFAEHALDVAQRACNAYGKILEWRKAQLYTVHKQTDPDGRR